MSPAQRAARALWFPAQGAATRAVAADYMLPGPRQILDGAYTAPDWAAAEGLARIEALRDSYRALRAQPWGSAAVAEYRRLSLQRGSVGTARTRRIVARVGDLVLAGVTDMVRLGSPERFPLRVPAPLHDLIEARIAARVATWRTTDRGVAEVLVAAAVFGLLDRLPLVEAVADAWSSSYASLYDTYAMAEVLARHPGAGITAPELRSLAHTHYRLDETYEVRPRWMDHDLIHDTPLTVIDGWASWRRRFVAAGGVMPGAGQPHAEEPLAYHVTGWGPQLAADLLAAGVTNAAAERAHDAGVRGGASMRSVLIGGMPLSWALAAQSISAASPRPSALALSA